MSNYGTDIFAYIFEQKTWVNQIIQEVAEAELVNWFPGGTGATPLCSSESPAELAEQTHNLINAASCLTKYNQSDTLAARATSLL